MKLPLLKEEDFNFLKKEDKSNNKTKKVKKWVYLFFIFNDRCHDFI